MKKIYLVFTRDFDQWVQEMVRNSLVITAKKVWGRGLVDQIVYYNGRTFEWYRYVDDMAGLKHFLINKKLSDPIFQKKNQDRFLADADSIKRLISVRPKRIRNLKGHLSEITKLFARMYPYYPLGIFIAGPWREDFRKIHGKDGKKILKLLYKSREHSEGLLKLVGLHLRQWLGQYLTAGGYPTEFIKLMSVKEIKDLVNKQSLPPKSKLLARSKRFVYINNKILPITDFPKFLKQSRIKLDQDNNANKPECQGSVAYSGKTYRGKVQTIFNSSEVINFKKGNILVTPMTSPEYLPAMKTAKAVVTDEGGITSHAAITARELKIPTIIGTKFATKVFKDGDLVEVDANKGIVRKI